MNTQATTIKQLLQQAGDRLQNCVESPSLDSEVLLAHCFHKTRTFLHTWPDKEVPAEIAFQFQELIQQRCNGVPVAYLTGEREFWSLDFIVDQHTLIPRPETERLVEISLDLIRPMAAPRILDVGTGAGPIACALAHERRDARVVANDISLESLQVTAKNKQRMQLTNLELYQGNFLQGVKADQFDLIVSNPPYIAADDPHLSQGDVAHEPRRALVASDQGLADIKLLCKQAHSALRDKGYLLLEHGYEQREAVVNIFTELKYSNIQTFDDLSGNPRLVLGQSE
jgi:release factor glutamine methyltransferase